MTICDMERAEMLENIEVPEAAGSELEVYLGKINPKDTKFANYSHFCHVFIFARTNARTWDKYDRRAIVLMQIRFDGHLGFPGGAVDTGEDPVQALNRELIEESGWMEESGPVTDEHYLFSSCNEKTKSIYHFYGIEVTEQKITELEKNTLQTVNWGEEVLGICRVPLYKMLDSSGGLPSFLHNNFIGNSKFQLIQALIHFKLLPSDCIVDVINCKSLT